MNKRKKISKGTANRLAVITVIAIVLVSMFAFAACDLLGGGKDDGGNPNNGVAEAEKYYLRVDFETNNNGNDKRGGSIEGSNANGDYEKGTVVTLTATPSEGYTFVGWYIGGQKKYDNPTVSHTMTGEASAIARFASKTYRMHTAVPPELRHLGNTDTEAGKDIKCGDEFTVTATPYTLAGAEFVGWYDKDDYEANQATATKLSSAVIFTTTMPAKNFTLIAVFKMAD